MDQRNSALLLGLIGQYGGKVVKTEGEPCFVLHSGLHTRVKYDFERVFQIQHARNRFAHALIDALCHFPVAVAPSPFLPEKIDVLAGDVSMGAFLAEVQTIPFFGRSRLALAKKKNDNFFFDANLDLRKGDRILLVDDVITTGITLFELTDALCCWYTAYSTPVSIPHIIGSAVLLDRSFTPASQECIPAPFVSLLHDSETKPYPVSECPHCLKR